MFLLSAIKSKPSVHSFIYIFLRDFGGNEEKIRANQEKTCDIEARRSTVIHCYHNR